PGLHFRARDRPAGRRPLSVQRAAICQARPDPRHVYRRRTPSARCVCRDRQSNPDEEMTMDTGLTTIAEADIAKHQAMAQSMITPVIVLEDSSGQSATALAGTGRRFVSTVSTGSVRKSREVELAKTVAAIHADDPLMGIPQHTLLYRARRGLQIALAISAVFA